MAEDGKNPNQPNTPEEAMPELQSQEGNKLDTSSDSKGVLDRLEDMGSLEVEDMPESNELQERRRKTKSRLQELSNIQNESEPTESNAFEDEEESGLMDLLREANLSPRHLKFCCGGILVVILLVALVFGGKAAFDWWQSRPDKPEVVEEDEPEVQEPEKEDGEEESVVDSSILGSILVGEGTTEEDEATSVGENIGDNSDNSDDLSKYINDFAKIFASLEVDVNELLNQSSNRTDTLNDYVSELNYLSYLAAQNLASLEGESESLAEKFTAIEEQKEANELRFFTELQDLDAPAANTAFETFIDEGQDIVRLRAEFNARQKLISYYEQAVAILERRSLDIELNREALLKGVRVVEVEGSDLNLIIQEEDL